MIQSPSNINAWIQSVEPNCRLSIDWNFQTQLHSDKNNIKQRRQQFYRNFNGTVGVIFLNGIRCRFWTEELLLKLSLLDDVDSSGRFIYAILVGVCIFIVFRTQNNFDTNERRNYIDVACLATDTELLGMRKLGNWSRAVTTLRRKWPLLNVNKQQCDRLLTITSIFSAKSCWRITGVYWILES